MNNIIFQTNLLRGAQGPQGDTGTAEAIPSDAVVWYDGNEAPAGFVETTAPSGISSIQNAVDVVSARVDKIEALPDGSTTADAELVDIRVGADGTSYTSAGNAVRGQVTALDDKIDNTNETQDYTISANSIVGTAEGNPITITDGGNCNARKLIATLSPTQAGSGDPSPTNVRPISGVSTLNVNRTGKNIAPFVDNVVSSASNLTLSATSDGGIHISGTPSRDYAELTSNISIYIPSGTTITLSRSVAKNYRFYIHITYADGSTYDFIVGRDETSATLTLSKDVVSFIAYLSILSTSTNYDETIYPQLEFGSSATTYEPYQGTTLSLSLGSTVYGGSVDLNTGVLTVDRVGVTFDGSSDENWSLFGSGSASAYAMKIEVEHTPFAVGGLVTVMANYLEGISRSATWGDYPSFVSTHISGIIAGINTITTVADWKTYLASNNLQVVYELATPLTTQLTPQTLRLLQGNNTLWTNAEGLEVEYVKDATIIINDILSRLEALEG